jgi:peptidoglycan/LPS O-acetylase OafA/YrhL
MQRLADALRSSIGLRRRPARLHATSFLDGLRGVAALLVYLHHHQLWFHGDGKADVILESAFGHNSEYHIATLPGIRLLFSGGHFAVAVFFVISGFSLSYRPLRLIQSGLHAELSECLSSALFRRWLRLYLPVVATTFVFMTICWMFAIQLGGPPLSSWSGEASAWCKDFLAYSYVFVRPAGAEWLKHNIHLWSIPLEFKGSILIYTTLLGLSRCSGTARLYLLLLLTAYFLYVVDGWYCAMFLGGSLLCQIHIARHLCGTNPVKDHTKGPVFLMLLLMSFALYLGGVPHRPTVEALRLQPGWYYVSFLKPLAMSNPTWFYLFWSAMLLVYSVSSISQFRTVFESPTCQHLGRVAFGLYLCHGPILWSIGDPVYRLSKEIVRGDTTATEARVGWPIGFDIAFFLGQLILFPTTLFAAELVAAYVDKPSVAVAKRLYRLSQEQRMRWAV